MSGLLNAPIDPPDIPRLVRRRRITWVVAAVFGVCAVVALALDGADVGGDAASILGGFAIIAVIVCVVVNIQYTARVWRLRREHTTELRRLLTPAGSGADMNLPSVTSAPLQRLRAAHALLIPALPAIENREPGIGALAERSRQSLQRTATRIVLLERMQAPVVRAAAGSDESTADAEPANELRELTDRFDRGVARYVELAAQAAMAADGLQTAGITTAQIQDAADRLAGLAQGLRQVEQINDPGSSADR